MKIRNWILLLVFLLAAVGKIQSTLVKKPHNSASHPLIPSRARPMHRRLYISIWKHGK